MAEKVSGRLDETIVVRVTKEMKREILKWAGRNQKNLGDMTRKLIASSLGMQDDQWQLPPGIKPLGPAQGAPRT